MAVQHSLKRREKDVKQISNISAHHSVSQDAGVIIDSISSATGAQKAFIGRHASNSGAEGGYVSIGSISGSRREAIKPTGAANFEMRRKSQPNPRP